MIPMIMAGKTTPEHLKITNSVLDGFSHLELQLETKHLDNIGVAKENIQTAIDELEKMNKPLTIVSMHTPHFHNGQEEYLKKTLDLSRHFNAYAIFHSNQLTIEETLDIAKRHADDRLILENKTNMDLQSIVHNILPHHNMALDIAHLYRGSQNIYHDLEILITTYKKKIKIIHLNDATKEKDGLPIGDGVIDFPTIMNILKKTGYKEPVIIETPPDTQLESREKIEKLTM
ncbi:MAG: TIM barrel protein [archaeon]